MTAFTVARRSSFLGEMTAPLNARISLMYQPAVFWRTRLPTTRPAREARMPTIQGASATNRSPRGDSLPQGARTQMKFRSEYRMNASRERGIAGREHPGRVKVG